MPFTAYHLGPSGFVGLLFRKWLDVPVFILANVIVDIEVLIWDKWPVHRYAHTLLLGAAIGAAWGLLAYPARPLLKKIMQLLRIPYQTNLFKMLISGVLGVWLHVLIDAIYHGDVQLFWPSQARPLFGLIVPKQVEAICLIFFIPAAILYATALLPSIKQNMHAEGGQAKKQN